MMTLFKQPNGEILDLGDPPLEYHQVTRNEDDCDNCQGGHSHGSPQVVVGYENNCGHFYCLNCIRIEAVGEARLSFEERGNNRVNNLVDSVTGPASPANRGVARTPENELVSYFHNLKP